MADFKGFVSHIIYRSEDSGYTVFEVTLTDVGQDGTLDGAEAVSGYRESRGQDGKAVDSKGKAEGSKGKGEGSKGKDGGSKGKAEGSKGKGKGSRGKAEGEGSEGKAVGSGKKSGEAAVVDPGDLFGDVITCVGYPVSISEGESCAVSGEYVTHPVYGGQLRVKNYRVIAPENSQAMYRYLAAGSIKGIGQAMAAKIVRRFGDDTLRIMEEEPEKLAEIKGISMRIAREIGAQMEDKKDLRDAMIFLQKYGIGSAHAARIWQAYGIELYEIMKVNPYRLAEDIRGIGFATADEIARRIGIRADSEYRIRSGLLYILTQAAGEGHSFLPRELLIRRTCALLRISEEEVAVQLENLAVERRVRILHRRSPLAEQGNFEEGVTEDAEAFSAEDFNGDGFSGGGFSAEGLKGDGFSAEGLNGVAFTGRGFSAEGFSADDFSMQGFSAPGVPAGNYEQRAGGGPAGEPEAVEVYLSGFFRREQEIARMLLDLDVSVHRHAGGRGAGERMKKKIAGLEKEEHITLDPLQRKAVLEAAENAILMISGGPGTGKTTTINTIIRFFEEDGLDVLLAAPTGRAARRMTEATGKPAMTIHRLLGIRTISDDTDREGLFDGEDMSAPGGRGGDKKERNYRFERGEDNPLEADVVIIDEMSMVDMNLFHALLKAVPQGARLVLVGDVNQLPSVGPGCVLQDLIESKAFHTIMLQHVFRQASESDIVMNAHRILEGHSLPMDNKSRDFFFLERDQAPVIYKHTVQLIREMLPGYAGCRPEDIQVLTPMRRGSLGVDRLNEVLQSVLNPPADSKREYVRQETVFREGDKVMQTRNNYNMEWEKRGNFNMPIDRGMGIFNGDFGRIEEIDTRSASMTVCFDDARTVEYPFTELEDLELAYAITVHKSQGSEYPAVILPILTGPSGLFNRNLLYTAVTRARNCVVILGSRDGVDRMIANVRRTRRYTGLRERIVEFAEMTGIGTE